MKNLSSVIIARHCERSEAIQWCVRDWLLFELFKIDRVFLQENRQGEQ
ncbi:MAG: hypothetical protein FWE16_06030 [Firmicutes bacterium]|nr:hypothetical protein [Bacillota bacterium]